MDNTKRSDIMQKYQKSHKSKDMTILTIIFRLMFMISDLIEWAYLYLLSVESRSE